MSPERLARVQTGWERFAGPARVAWEEHRRHCSGIARHYHQHVEEGFTQVARKWYGITDAHLQPEYTGPPASRTPFLEMDEAFVGTSPALPPLDSSLCARLRCDMAAHSRCSDSEPVCVRVLPVCD